MKVTATMKQADAQLSKVALLLISAKAASDESPNEDVVPTREKAQEAVVARPMEARKLRTRWNS